MVRQAGRVSYNEGVMTDHAGRIIGHWWTRKPHVLEGRDWIVARDFLLTACYGQSKKERGKLMEMRNSVEIAGIVKTIHWSGENDEGAFLLIDVGNSSKYLPCSVYKTPSLLERLRQFKQGDFIMIRGFLRGWSQQKNGEWKNGMDVRITEIGSTGAVRMSPSQSTKKQPKQQQMPTQTATPPAPDDFPY